MSKNGASSGYNLHFLLILGFCSTTCFGLRLVLTKPPRLSPLGSVAFDEAAYEKERLSKDAEAMQSMKEEADMEFAKGLRTPWKWKLRKRIWDYMEDNDIARFPRPVHHRIPNFVGADKAAERLAELPEFQAANMVKCNPDTPQRPVRHIVLEQGKTLLTPQPRLRTGFFSTIRMDELPSLVKVEQCTNSKGVVKYGTPVTLNEQYTVDLVVVGSTAVCPRTGARVGKGEGFAELEWGILSAQGNLDPEKCVVVSTVHDCQVIDNEEDMPEGWELTQHDVPVDIIVTPTRTIHVSNRKPKPSGIFWELLSPQKLAAIRVLRQLKQQIEASLGKPLPSGPDEVLPPTASRKPQSKQKATNVRGGHVSIETKQQQSKSRDAATENLPPPIVYTIAGSDSGGGAGIQADLLAIHAMGCHGCSAITCLTAQNSQGVTGVHAPPGAFLMQQLEALSSDLAPKAIKIGMLGTRELAEVVGGFLNDLKQQSTNKIWVVLDPVMISTSGSRLLEDDAVEAMIEHVFPHADVVTPNKFEAEALLGRTLQTPNDVEEGAKDLLKLGCASVLIKGGHTLIESSSSSSSPDDSTSITTEVQSTLDFAQDFLLSSEPLPDEGMERLCDASRGVWLRTPRWNSDNTHGTGCTLSSAMASALALGEQNRQSDSRVGAKSSIQIVDACCLAKAYVSAGIQRGVQLGSGPGPVAQTTFPCSSENFPSIVLDPTAPRRESSTDFCKMEAYSDDDSSSLGRLLPIIDTVEWVERLSKTPGITDIQLRVKDEKDPVKIMERVKTCQGFCEVAGVRLWINDHWQAAIEAGCFGVHLGQEDLFQCMQAGGLEMIKSKNVALGISTHSYGELAAALGVKPTYISMGPVFATSSKKVAFDPQGLETVRKWRDLIPPLVPFMTIGGINDVEAARLNCEAGADSIAVISAITNSPDPAQSVTDLNNAMTKLEKLC